MESWDKTKRLSVLILAKVGGLRTEKHRPASPKIVTYGTDCHIWRPQRAEVKQKVSVLQIKGGWAKLQEVEMLQKIPRWTARGQKE